MELFKIITLGDKVLIKMLICNERVWSGYQWKYNWVRTDSYPTNDERYATDFKGIAYAEAWIKEHTPR